MLDKRAIQIIEKIPYITVASVTNEGMPWNSPVFGAHDSEFNFYFGTYKLSQKAKNIFQNPNIFLVIYDSTAPPGSGEGVYIQAQAAAVTDPEEIKAAHELLWSRHVEPYWKLEEFTAPSPLVIFKVVPKKVWMNAEGEADGHYIDTRREVAI
jgi:general stress protein 26